MLFCHMQDNLRISSMLVPLIKNNTLEFDIIQENILWVPLN